MITNNMDGALVLSYSGKKIYEKISNDAEELNKRSWVLELDICVIKSL